MSSKIKFGVLAVLAALLFALPGALGKAGSVSAAPVISNGQGDVCGLWSNAGNQPNGKIEVPVGAEFDVLARLEDSFHLPLIVQAAAAAQNGNPPATAAVGYFGPLLPPGNYMVGVILNPFDDPDVIPFYVSASIDSQTGEAKIVDRIEDHSISNVTFRFPFIERNGVSWTWPSILNVIDFFGVATENVISPVDTVNALDVLTELAGGGGDLDVGGGAIGGSYNSDIQEFFVNNAWTSLDETVAKNALNNCGLPILSGNASITASNMGAIWVDMIYCFTTGDVGACNDLAIQLGLNCSIAATTGCTSAAKDIFVNLDGWSEVSVECTKPGQVKITFDPTTWFDANGNYSPAHNEGKSLDIECIGPANSATAVASPTTVEIKPVGTSVSLSTITVTVLDANGKRLDGAVVTFSTNDCNLGTSSTGPFSQQSVSTVSDTDSTSDLSYIAQNSAPGNQLFAGTAEAYLQCNVTGATPGTATVTWIVNAQINQVFSATGISGTVTVNVVGPPSSIKLDVSPATSTCGNPVTATATVTDAAGKPVSDGTQVFFTTTTATGTQGGTEGAQGAATTVNGVASVTLSIDPMDAGTHTVSARTGGNDLTGAAVAVVNATPVTINCSAVAAAAPAAPATVTAPKTGQGPTIVPPNTGDAGLAASSSSSSYGLIALAGVVAMALVGVASLKFVRR